MHASRISWIATALAAASAIGLAAPETRADVRSPDGSGNNPDHPEWGSAGVRLRRLAPPAYADGVSAPSGPDRPATRFVSDTCGRQADNMMSDQSLSAMHFLWGQFIDHDITLTPDGSGEPFPIPVPAGDPWFDPAHSGTAVIPMMRSTFDPASGGGPGDPRQQINVITAFLDASMVYGSDAAVADALRLHDGTGRLRTSDGDLLPWNDLGLPMANPLGLPTDELFAAGDVRANENGLLTAMHVLFVREHNRLCFELMTEHPSWDDEALYQHARRIVGGLVQAITYQEYLPALLGSDALPKSSGYDPALDPGIATEFSAAAFRLGHSMLNEVLHRLETDGAVVPAGHAALAHAFFAPSVFLEANIGAWLHGAAVTGAQHIDARVTGALRNFLFGPPGAGGLDLLAINLQRARDHGIPSYNAVRVALGLPPVASFAEITSDPDAAAGLADTYGDVELVDPWIGMMSEDHLPGAAVGPLARAIVVDQFVRLRDGDRFWYERDPALSPLEIDVIGATALADVIARNTDWATPPADVFRAPGGMMPELADFDMDGLVGLDDLLVLVASWGPLGTPGQDARADVDGDAVVGFTDLVYLLAHWTS